MVEAEGIEPSSASDPQKGATYLVRILFVGGASTNKIYANIPPVNLNYAAEENPHSRSGIIYGR